MQGLCPDCLLERDVQDAVFVAVPDYSIVQQKTVKSSDLAREALIPFYRQLLPVLNEFLLFNKNLSHMIEYGQRKMINIGDLI
jgi:hypothetical protein